MGIYLIISILLIIFLITGLVIVYKKFRRNNDKLDFISKYRNKFIELTNTYFKTRKINDEKYIWLTKNVNQVQRDIGKIGLMDYIAPFQTYQVSNYQIVINTIPKFRDGSIKDFDVNSTDDALLRYIGVLEERIEFNKKELFNPIIWFRKGFQEIMSIPLFILYWFGIFTKQRVDNIMESTIYKIFMGIGALLTIAASIVTVIQGKAKTLEFINNLLGN